MKTVTSQNKRGVGPGPAGEAAPRPTQLPDQAQLGRLLARMAIRHYLWLKGTVTRERHTPDPD
jgi:hypothetical protein